jgi:asparagine synthase (glutamine-hydrolysing)
LSASLGVGHAELARMSDSALLLRCLLRWQDEALPKLVGDFAFAWWDARHKRLLMARDIMGARPLHYRDGADFFAFASMPSGLHALPMVPRDVDYAFLAEHLALLPQRMEGTFWNGIKRVPPGYLVTVTRKGVKRWPFWTPPPAADAGPTGREAEEGLREVIDQAVKAQLRSSRSTVATHLSSGLDSSIVTSTAARLHAPNDIVAFTATPQDGFDGFVPRHHYADESALAALVAGQYANVCHRIVKGSTKSSMEQLDTDCAYMQQPPANLCNLSWLNDIYREARDAGANTLLIAAGGNVTISYSGSDWLRYLLRRGKLIELTKVLRALKSNGSTLRGLAVEVAGPFAPSFLWKAAMRRIGQPIRLSDYSAIHQDAMGRVRQSAAERGFDLLYRPHSHPTDARWSMCSHTDGGNSIKAVLARWGISVRDPTVDKRVIEYCLRLPYQEFLRGGIRRSLARRSFRDRVPASILDNQQRGYQAADWEGRLAGDHEAISALIESVAHSPAARHAIDAQWLRTALTEWESKAMPGNDALVRIRGGLLRGVSAAHFVRRVEGANQ